jgi:hypothetical protein
MVLRLIEPALVADDRRMAACPRCGARLSTGISWCGNCLAPQRRNFAPRPELHPPGYAPEEEPRVVSTRTRAGPTTHGLRGRVIWTVAIVGVFIFGLFTPFVLSFVIGYPMLAGMALRSIWKRETVSTEVAGKAILPQELQPLGAAIRRRASAVLLGLSLCGAVVAFELWGSLGTTGRGVVVLAILIGLVGVVTAWFSDGY